MMSGPATQVLLDDSKKLKKEVADLRLETSKFLSIVSTQIAIIKWLGVFFAGILTAFFIGALTLAWNASAMNFELKAQDRRIEQQGTRIDQLSKSWEAVIERLDRIDHRLESLGARPNEDAARKSTQSGD
jgi:hypothetical protein